MSVTINPFTGEMQLTSGGGGGTDANAFSIIQPDAGTSPTASSTTDTLTITSSDASIVNTGNAAQKKIDLKLATSITGARTITNSSGLTAGSATEIDTGSPNTKGLIVKGNTYVVPSTPPSSISGLKVWLKADAISGVSDGALLTTWSDSSGNGYDATQGTSGSRPTYHATGGANNSPYITLTGGKSLSNSTLVGTGTGDLTIIAVGRSTSFGSNQTFVAVGAAASAQEVTLGLNSSGAIRSHDIASALANYATPTFTASTFGIASLIKTGNTAINGWVNGVAETGGSTVLASTNIANGYFVGSYDGAGGEGLTGDISEIIVYNRALSTAERQSVEGYLIAKYITATTPQASNLYEGQDSSGNVLFSVSPAGNVTTPALNVTGLTASKVLASDASKNVVATSIPSTMLTGLDPRQGSVVFDDFDGNSTSSSASLWQSSVSGGAISQLAFVSSHPGIWRHDTGTTSTGRASSARYVTAQLAGAGSLEFNACVRVPTLSTSTDEFTFMVGWGDTQTADQVDSAGYFMYDRATSGDFWVIKTASNSTRTATVTSTAVVAGNWYTFKALTNAAGTQTDFYIATNGGAYALAGSITTNIPTAAGREFGSIFALNKTVGTTARQADFDMWWQQSIFTSSR